MRQQNFHKKPHTARWLMTFHTAGMNYRPEVDTEEQAAVAFVGGGAPQANNGAAFQPGKAFSAASDTREIFIRGWRILTGPGLITEKQAAWVVSIAEDKDGVTDEMIRSLAERLTQGFARAAASDFITKYKDLPRRQREISAEGMEAIAPGADSAEFKAHKNFKANSMPEIAAGRYAVEIDGELKFYRVTKGKGKWQGRTFIEVQASDDHYPVRTFASRNQVLRAIADAGEEEAMRRYGREIGACGRCGRTLTSEYREMGIGPICINK